MESPYELAHESIRWVRGSVKADLCFKELIAIRREDPRKIEGIVFIPTPKTGRRKGIETRRFPRTPEMVSAIEARDRFVERIVRSEEGQFGMGPKQAQAQLDSP